MDPLGLLGARFGPKVVRGLGIGLARSVDCVFLRAGLISRARLINGFIEGSWMAPVCLANYSPGWPGCGGGSSMIGV